jgi:hypothetical protein
MNFVRRVRQAAAPGDLAVAVVATDKAVHRWGHPMVKTDRLPVIFRRRIDFRLNRQRQIASAVWRFAVSGQHSVQVFHA